MSLGVYYIATGQKYCSEVIENIQLSLSFFESIPISILTDCVHFASSFDFFDNVIPFASPVYGYRDKIVGLKRLPYKHTLFLDTDAKPCASIASWLSQLTHFQFAGSFAPVRVPPGWRDGHVPDFFPEINTGVMYFKRSRLNSSLINSWLSLYDSLYLSHAQSWDQASFRSVLWKFVNTMNYRYHILPAEFNLRTTKPWIVGRGLSSKIVHGRFPASEWQTFVTYLNQDIDKFRYFSEWNKFYPLSLIRPRYDRTFF